MYRSQVRRETEFLPRTGKPNKKASKTAPDNRQSFINKDVLSMKIIAAAKQNMAQDPELLSEVCQQTLLKETVQQRGQEWHHGGLFSLNDPLHLCQPTFQKYDLLSGVQRVQGSRAFRQSDNKGWCVCQLSSAPVCHQCGVLSSGGRVRGTTAEKQGD